MFDWRLSGCLEQPGEYNRAPIAFATDSCAVDVRERRPGERSPLALPHVEPGVLIADHEPLVVVQVRIRGLFTEASGTIGAYEPAIADDGFGIRVEIG